MPMRFVLLCFVSLFALGVFGQRNVRDSAIATPWVSVHYGLNWPLGDLKERFGLINHIGGIVSYKTKRNWIYGLESNFTFGNKVKIPDMFANIADSYGNITDENGEVASVTVSMRGFNVNAIVGKVFPVLSPNENSGIYANVGLGYVQYRALIETPHQVVPSIELKYRKGYDRYTTGLNLQQFLGYAFMSNYGVLNFYGGFYAMEGLTYNRRNINFDEPNVPVSKKMRLDVQLGFKVGWFIPIYKRKPKEFYFN